MDMTMYRGIQSKENLLYMTVVVLPQCILVRVLKLLKFPMVL